MSYASDSFLFRNSIETMIDYFQSYKENNALHYGPVYKIKYKNRDISMNSFFSEMKPNYNHPYSGRLIMAIAECGNEITGVGMYSLIYKPDQGYLEGRIDTFPKNQGHLMPFCIGLSDFFQREADRLQKSVFWNVRNNNYDFAEMTLMGTWSFGNGRYNQNLEEAQAEQERWQSVFGHEGKLGCQAYENDVPYTLFGKKLLKRTRKIFTPRKYEDIEKIGEIEINYPVLCRITLYPNGNTVKSDLTETLIRKLRSRKRDLMVQAQLI